MDSGQLEISASEFKAKCLALLDEVGTTGGTITITRRGRPLATVRPARQRAWKSIEGAWVGKVSLPEDFVERDTSRVWNIVRDPDSVL